MTETESHYSNIESKLLGVLFSVEHLKHFIYGRRIHIITDHKPLVSIFRKSISQVSPHLACMLLRLADYDLCILYQEGKKMHWSDTVSHQSNHSQSKDDSVEGINVSIPDIEVNISYSRLQQIQIATQHNGVLQTLQKYIPDGWPSMAKECSETKDHSLTYAITSVSLMVW